jgi:hypothetical protein
VQEEGAALIYGSHWHTQGLRSAHEPRARRSEGGLDRYVPSSLYHERQTNIGLDDEGNIRYRKLGLIVARGTLLVVISPVDGSEEIANPFIQEEE